MSAKNLQPSATPPRPSCSPDRQEIKRLRQRLAEAEAELEIFRRRQKWVEESLAAQRHARQVLEAAISATYTDTITRIRDVVRAAIPRDATVLVVSKGDEELLKIEGRRGWHFPQDDKGGYVGYHPEDSAAAIGHLHQLIAKGGQFLLLPNTAFWWLEHYRAFGEHLESSHFRVWRDDRCAIYKLYPNSELKHSSEAGAASRDAQPASLQDVQPTLPGRLGIICFPIIDWNYRFQRPQQLMRQFAAAGHRVFYLSHEFRKSGDACLFRLLAENLYEVSLRGSRFKVRQGVLDDDSRQALSVSLSALQRSCPPGNTTAMVQSPFWWPIAKAAAVSFGWPIVYDCMDWHAGFATANPLLLELERELLAQADLVVVSSGLLELEARRYNRNVLLVRNGCDYAHFAKVQPKAPGPRPVIGYYGAISDWFDSDLVADLAVRRPDWDFVLVGSTFSGDVSRLSKLPNVALPGEKPYAEIPDWLARFDVTILPFKRTPLTEAANPVKAYEIFAAGKSLVSVPLPEVIPLAPLVRFASTAQEFEREIAAELTQTKPNSRRERRTFARNNTWQNRFERLSQAAENLFVKQHSGPTAPSGQCKQQHSAHEQGHY